MERKIIVIKKYENRRLYDTANSRYVNLDEVAQAVREGAEVQVVDAATGEDITRLILTQIIVEDAKTANSVFPLDVLRQMVIASGRASQESTLKYLKGLFEMYRNAYRAFTPPLIPFDFLNSMAAASTRVPVEEPVAPGRAGVAHDVAHDTAQASPERQEAAATPTPEAVPEAKEGLEVKELRQRIDELATLVSKLGSEQMKRKQKRKPRHYPPASQQR